MYKIPDNFDSTFSSKCKDMNQVNWSDLIVILFLLSRALYNNLTYILVKNDSSFMHFDVVILISIEFQNLRTVKPLYYEIYYKFSRKCNLS